MPIKVSPDRLEGNPWNPNVMEDDIFQGLKASMEEDNYDPLIVSPRGIVYPSDEGPEDSYVIVDGYWRWKAAIDLGLQTLRVDVRRLSADEVREQCYKRGKQRGHLDPFLEAELFQTHIDEGLTEEEVARRYNLSRSYVASRRSLLRIDERVRKLYSDPEEGLREMIREESETEGEEIPEEDLKQKVEDSVPRGTKLSVSHLEALSSLPEPDQEELGRKALRWKWTVRDLEDKVKSRKDERERQRRFQEALEKAVEPVCPVCGTEPEDFFWEWEVVDGVHRKVPDYTRFRCPNYSCELHTWNYMEEYQPPEQEEVTPESMMEQAEEAVARSGELAEEAEKGPAYVRRLEDVDTLKERIAGWALRKIKQFDGIKKVEITGRRGDKTIHIKFPTSYTNGLYYYLGGYNAESDYPYSSTYDRRFGFTMESKDYKTLEEKTKIDLSGEPSPEKRAQIHHFLDEVTETDEDPWLPETREELEQLLAKYGEGI